MGTVYKQKVPYLFLLILVLPMSSLYTVTVAFSQNPFTQEYFDRITSMPFREHENEISSSQFWKEGGDCTDRAIIFKEYLEAHGAKNVHLVIARNIQDGKEVNGTYDEGHCFVLWEGRVYNPIDDKYRIYDGDFQTYIQVLKNDYGFNTIFFDCGANGYMEI